MTKFNSVDVLLALKMTFLMGSCSANSLLSITNNSTFINLLISMQSIYGRDDKVSRIKNFTLLYDTFKTLRISFDSNIAMCIINRKPGMAKKVLYELKMVPYFIMQQLEKTAGTSFTKSKPSKTLSPLKKIQVSKDQFDKISKQHFNKQLNELHRAQKEIIQEKHLKKFSDFHQKELVKAQIQE